MKRRLVSWVGVGVAGFFLASLPGRADDSQLSPERLDLLDHLGCFTPGFKAAVHELVDSKQAIVTAKMDEKKFSGELPDLQKQVADAEAQAAQLHQELDSYDHGAETDFAALQGGMKNAGAKPEDQLVQAQAYIWAYPASPHLAEAQQDLQEVQQKLADQRQAEKDAEAARAAARAKLVERVQARDLSLTEWRDFLRDMSQDDLLKYLGRPQSEEGDFWVYTGDWTTDPVTHLKVGMQINFNAGRVNSVAVVPN